MKGELSKEELLHILNEFNLDFYVDYDQWEEKGWIRVKSERINEDEHTSKDDWFKPLILWKDDTDNLHRIGRYVYAMGKYAVKKQLKGLLNLGSL